MQFSSRAARLLVMTALVILAACSENGATASKTTTYQLPPTPGPRICINQCSEAKNYCKQTCNMDYRRCTSGVQAKALTDYDDYTRRQFAAHAPIELRPSDFERMEPCERENKICTDDCEGHYKICYQGCGGTVSETTSCQYLCF